MLNYWIYLNINYLSIIYILLNYSKLKQINLSNVAGSTSKSGDTSFCAKESTISKTNHFIRKVTFDYYGVITTSSEIF